MIVEGVSRDTSWQDLKDFGREAGSVSFADIDRDVPGRGSVFRCIDVSIEILIDSQNLGVSLSR